MLGDHVWTLQYHPEFSAGFMADLLDALADELPAQALTQGRAQITQPADGAWVMARIAQFFQASRLHPESAGP